MLRGDAAAEGKPRTAIPGGRVETRGARRKPWRRETVATPVTNHASAPVAGKQPASNLGGGLGPEFLPARTVLLRHVLGIWETSVGWRGSPGSSTRACDVAAALDDADHGR